MANNLSTILTSAGGRALVEEYLSTRLLERQDWDGVMANSQYLDDRGIPENSGQYVKFTRLGRFRRPQTMDLSTASNEYADPSSGAVFSTEIVQVPVEYLQEYIDIPMISAQTSWIDLRRWADEGLILCGGSDSSVTPIDPVLGIHAAVNPPYPENALTPAEALAMFTINGAYAAFEEGDKGSLTPGKLGDITVLSANPLTVDPAAIKDIAVEMTIVRGNVEYKK